MALPFLICFLQAYIHLELYKCTVISVSELAHSWGVFQYTVCSFVCICFLNTLQSF